MGRILSSSHNSLLTYCDILVIGLHLLIWSIHSVQVTGGPLKLSFNPASDNVQLDAPLVVRCEYDVGNGMDNAASMFLHCPIAPWGAFCFQNCKSACVGETPGSCPYEKQLGGVSCRTVVTQTGHVTYEYTIRRLTQEWLGTLPSGEHKTYGFYCKSAGSQTPEVWLYEGTKEIVSTVPAPTKPPKSPAANVPINETHQTNTQATNSRGPEDTRQSVLEIHTSAILRELLIVCAIVIVFVSVSVNVFCCIRCALIRQYSKNKRIPRMQHLFCMADEIHNARVARLYAHSKGWPDGPNELLYKNRERRFEQGSLGSGSRLLAPQQIPLSPDLVQFYHQQQQENQQLSAMSDTNSNATASVDVHTQSVKNGRFVSPIMTRSSFSLNPQMNVSLSATDKHTRPGSVILLQGPDGSQHLVQAQYPQNQQLAAAVASYCYEQQQNLKKLQDQVIGSEFGKPTNPSSDGLGSCQNSVGNPDSSLLEQYQVAPSAINTLRGVGSSGDPQLMMSSQDGQQMVRSSMAGAEIPMSYQTTPEQFRTQGDPNAQIAAGVLYQVADGRVQLMGSSQPQLGSGPVYARMNNSTSNPQLVHTFIPLAVGGASQSDSGTGSGSGQLSASGQPPGRSNEESNGRAGFYPVRFPYNGLMNYNPGPQVQYYPKSKLIPRGTESYTEGEFSSGSLKGRCNKVSVDRTLTEFIHAPNRVPSA